MSIIFSIMITLFSIVLGFSSQFMPNDFLLGTYQIAMFVVLAIGTVILGVAGSFQSNNE